jgi:hypothetical protein
VNDVLSLQFKDSVFKIHRFSVPLADLPYTPVRPGAMEITIRDPVGAAVQLLYESRASGYCLDCFPALSGRSAAAALPECCWVSTCISGLNLLCMCCVVLLHRQSCPTRPLQ